MENKMSYLDSENLGNKRYIFIL